MDTKFPLNELVYIRPLSKVGFVTGYGLGIKIETIAVQVDGRTLGFEPHQLLTEKDLIEYRLNRMEDIERNYSDKLAELALDRDRHIVTENILLNEITKLFKRAKNEIIQGS